MAISRLTVGHPLPLIDASIADARCNVLGHMRAAEYVALFDDAFLEFIRLTGLTGADLRHGTTTPFLLDLHATYLREVKPGDRVNIACQVLDQDERRARIILLMDLIPTADRTAAQTPDPRSPLAATCELAILNMDMAARRPVPWSPAQLPIWAELKAAHASIPAPPQAGRAIGPLVPR